MSGDLGSHHVQDQAEAPSPWRHFPDPLALGPGRVSHVLLWEAGSVLLTVLAASVSLAATVS